MIGLYGRTKATCPEEVIQIREDSHLREKMTLFEPSTSLVLRDG